MEKTINTLVIPMDEAFYNDLNRASREYEAAVVDCYYYIINGGTITDATFNRLFEEAVETHYAYSKLKDAVSNEIVIPKIAETCGIDANNYSINNTWNIPFDGSHKCTVSNIIITEGVSDNVVYSCECPDEYIENVAKLKVRINIINEIISKLNSTALNDFAENTMQKLKERRIEFMGQDNDNTKAFMSGFVASKIEEIGKSPENLIWTINVIDKTFTLTEKSNKITCTPCSSCN